MVVVSYAYDVENMELLRRRTRECCTAAKSWQASTSSRVANWLRPVFAASMRKPARRPPLSLRRGSPSRATSSRRDNALACAQRASSERHALLERKGAVHQRAERLLARAASTRRALFLVKFGCRVCEIIIESGEFEVFANHQARNFEQRLLVGGVHPWIQTLMNEGVAPVIRLMRLKDS